MNSSFRRLSSFAIATLVAVCACLPAVSTDQELDRIKIGEKEYVMLESPMMYFWSQERPKPNFDVEQSSNWSGYSAVWEIKHEKLILTSFLAKQKGKTVDTVKLFGQELPMEAKWVCGQLHATQTIEFSDGKRFAPSVIRFFLTDGLVMKTSNLQERVDCSRGALGITIGVRNYLPVVEKVTHGSAAQKSNELNVGDVIKAIVDFDDQQISLEKYPVEKVTQFLSGRIGQDCRLVVSRPDREDSRMIRIRRE